MSKTRLNSNMSDELYNMKKFKIQFQHTDNSNREIIIEAFNEERAKLRFEVNWGSDMKILNINEQ